MFTLDELLVLREALSGLMAEYGETRKWVEVAERLDAEIERYR